MSEHPTRQKLTEDDIREILLSDETHVDLARRLKVSKGHVYAIRKRQSVRVLKIAAQLGLLPLSPPRECWAPGSRTSVVVRAGFVRGRAGGEQRSHALSRPRP